MAELAYPYYRIQADGPNESGFVLNLHIEQSGGGPLPGQTMDSVIQGLKDRLAGTDVVVQVARYDITTTNNL